MDVFGNFTVEPDTDVFPHDFMFDLFDDDDQMLATVDLSLFDSSISEKADYAKMEKELKGDNRFRTIDSQQLSSFEDSHQSKKTRKNTMWALKLFQDWHTSTFNEPLDTSTVTEENLCQILRKFYCEATPKPTEARAKKLGSASANIYHKNTLKNIRSALNRHFADIGRGIDIVHGSIFKPANRTLDGFLKEQMKTGISLPTQHKPIIEKCDLEKISSYFSKAYSSPVILRQCVWFNIGLHFVSRGLEFHHQLRKDSFLFQSDDTGTEYVSLTHETQQKNFQGGLSKDEAPSDKRMYSTGGPGCPVAMLKLFIEKTCSSAHMLFNGCLKNSVLDETSEIWYSNKPLSKRSFSNFMADICKSSKTTGWYTAHSLRATAIQTLNDEGFEARHIMYMSGHRNESSLQSYCRTPSNFQKRKLSGSLSLATLSGQVKITAPTVAPTATVTSDSSHLHSDHSGPSPSTVKEDGDMKSSKNVEGSGTSGVLLPSGSFSNCIFNITNN